MALGLQHLKDLYDSNGYDFILKLFSNNVYITEKIDGSRFAFEKNNNKLSFFKRDERTPITMVDRTVMKYYESAISHIESLDLDLIPEGIRFGFEYFTNSSPGSIVYDLVPVNGLILTDVVTSGVPDTNIDSLVKYAKIFKTSPPPIIFNGKLSAKQKNLLEDFLLADWDDLFIKFKTESFTSYIIGIVNPKLKNMALNIGTSKPIEGVVFSFNDGNTFTNVKVVDPLYTQNARKIAKGRFTTEKRKSDSQTKIILRDIVSFIKNDANYDIEFKSTSVDMKFIELVSYLFKQYYLKNKGSFTSISSKTNSDEIQELDINYKFITDGELAQILKSNKKVKLVFKSVLAAFGKTRKRGNLVIDKSMLLDINALRIKLKKLSKNKVDYRNRMDEWVSNMMHRI